jgi:hypothetical protein
MHPAIDRFFTPLFSASSELLFSQPLSFHNHLRCPLVFSNRALHEPTAPASSPKSFLPRAKPRGIYRFLAPIQTEGYAICRFNGQRLLRPGGKPFVFTLLRALCALFLAPPLCFQWFADSFAKTPGVWVLNTESKPRLASHNIRPSGLQSRAAAASLRRLYDSPWSFDA